MNNFLGTTDGWLFVTLFFYALAGMSVMLLYTAANRNPGTPTTPYKFNLGFLLLDNWKRIVLNLLLIFITVRFYPDIFGKPITPFLALIAGLAYDKIFQLIKDNTGILQVDRSKLVDADVQKLPPKTIVIEK